MKHYLVYETLSALGAESGLGAVGHAATRSSEAPSVARRSKNGVLCPRQEREVI